MAATIKLDGFQPMHTASRPVLNRPFSDGSMTVDTSILTSIMSSTSAPTFGFSPSLSLPNHSFDYSLVSPHSTLMELPSGAGAAPHSFQPHNIFGHFNFGVENREPPIVTSAADPNLPASSNRSRSQSSSRSSHIGKVPSARSRSGRKLSMSDAKPIIQSPRGRTMQPPRSLSFHTERRQVLPMGPQRTDSIPADFTFDNQFGVAIPRADFNNTLWGQGGSAPSVLPEGMASYGASVDDTAIDSPVTPAQNAQAHLGDETRKQRRRECHNQVEKRRREHINAMIEELNQLLPVKFKLPMESDGVIEDEEEDDTNVESPIKKKKTKRAASSSKPQKDTQCKGRILSDSVQYIRDLKNVNEQQSDRIRFLESLLMGNDAAALSQNPNWQSLDDRQGNASLNYTHNQLEAMHASPEPEPLISLGQPGWNDINPASSILIFEPSPTDGSSAPDIRRSTSLSSGSPETDNKDAVWGMMDFTDEQRSTFTADESGSNDSRASASHGQPHDSQYELHHSLSNMDLDVQIDTRSVWQPFR